MISEKELLRLEQIVIEDEHSRKNVREKVKEDLHNSPAVIETEMLKVTHAIEVYLSKTYYKTKENRLNCIRHIPLEDITLELIIAVSSLTAITPIQQVAASLGQWLEYEDIFDGIKTAAELIAIGGETQLYTIIPANQTTGASIAIQPNLVLKKATLDFIESTRYLNPMVCPPKYWITNTEGGYITTSDSVLLGKYHHHNEKQCLDALNIAQNVEWELDPDVLAEEEMPNKPIETKEQEDAFKLFKNMSAKVYKELEGKSFYFVWRYDFRGRLYSQGYYINLQSTSYKKGLLNLKNKRLIQ